MKSAETERGRQSVQLFYSIRQTSAAPISVLRRTANNGTGKYIYWATPRVFVRGNESNGTERDTEKGTRRRVNGRSKKCKQNMWLR